MKLSLLSVFFTAGVANAFAPRLASTQPATQLNLFGGGAKKEGDKKGPGMMDQLAMFKKAQEMAQKKKKLDDELAKENFLGVGADGKVKANIKFIPIQNPMDPNPEYETISFEFDDEWFEAASPEDLSAAVKEAIFNGVETTNQAVVDKYNVLQGDLMEAFGQAAPPKEES